MSLRPFCRPFLPDGRSGHAARPVTPGCSPMLRTRAGKYRIRAVGVKAMSAREMRSQKTPGKTVLERLPPPGLRCLALVVRSGPGAAKVSSQKSFAAILCGSPRPNWKAKTFKRSSSVCRPLASAPCRAEPFQGQLSGGVVATPFSGENAVTARSTVSRSWSIRNGL